MEPYDHQIGEYCRADAGPTLDRMAERHDDRAAEALEALYAPVGDLLPSPACQRAMTGRLARDVRPGAAAGYMIFLLGRMWAVLGQLSALPDARAWLTAEFVEDLRDVYARMPYAPPGSPSTYPKLWFGLARSLGVDLREREDCRIVPDWGFGEDFLFSETWAWAKYHAHLDDSDVLDAVEAKLRTLADGNLLANLLRDLADLPPIGAGVRGLLGRFADNPLMTDNGIDGAPTPTVSEEVRILLARL